VAAATALDINLSLNRGYILRTDVALLVAIDSLMMALIAVPVLGVLHVARRLPGIPSLLESAPRASILLAAWAPVGLLRSRRLTEPFSVLPELLLVVDLADRHPELVSTLSGELERFQSEVQPLLEARPAELDEEILRLATHPPEPPAPGDEPRGLYYLESASPFISSCK